MNFLASRVAPAYGFALACLSLLIVAAGPCAADAAPPRLHAQGNQLVDPAGHEVILRGVSFPYLSQKRDRSVNERIDMAADMGATVIRLPLYGLHRSLDPIGADETYIRPAVEHATQRGLYVIIDYHEVSDLRQRLPNLHYFWYEIAARYKDQPNVIFELFNEDSYYPDGKGREWSDYKKLITSIVKVARERAPDTLLLVGCGQWDQKMEGIVADPIDDANVAYVTHLYPGHERKYWDQAAEVKKHYPVFVAEFGWQNKPIGNEKPPQHPCVDKTGKWGDEFHRWLNDNRMSWTAWCFDDRIGPPMFDAQWNLLPGPDFMGEPVKQWLNDGAK